MTQSLVPIVSNPLNNTVTHTNTIVRQSPTEPRVTLVDTITFDVPATSSMQRTMSQNVCCSPPFDNPTTILPIWMAGAERLTTLECTLGALYNIVGIGLSFSTHGLGLFAISSAISFCCMPLMKMHPICDTHLVLKESSDTSSTYKVVTLPNNNCPLPDWCFQPLCSSPNP